MLYNIVFFCTLLKISPLSLLTQPHGPGTPIMQSPQEPNNDVNYGMMKGMPPNMNVI